MNSVEYPVVEKSMEMIAVELLVVEMIVAKVFGAK
jgi:hypothetical protein